MRLNHKAGEKLFVDYAGQTVPVIDPKTGEIQEAEIFVAVLGASSYTYAEAQWHQDLPNWIGGHVCTSPIKMDTKLSRLMMFSLKLIGR